MNITINDKPIELAEGSTLSQALNEQKIAREGIAAAVNGAVIAKDNYDSHVLANGDSVIIIKAFYGG